jgi:tRNA(adenine34) deaminase
MERAFFSHEYFMKEALKEGQRAFERDEVPVGAVVVANNMIIARAHNFSEALNDVTAHAEMQAITAAAHALGSKYLTDCTLYVTLEPCIMCAGALFWAQIGAIVFGSFDSKRGYSLIKQGILHPKTSVISGIMANESEELIKNFFLKKR